MNKRSPVISLIGRPNTGKSTIFNRLMRKSFKAMTFDQPGVTRDRHYDICSLQSKTMEDSKDLILVDTGGFYPEKIEEDKRKQRAPAEPFFDEMADQAKLAIEESDLVLFVVDVREGLLPFDKSIADYIRTTRKEMWLVVNKFDSDKQWGEEVDFYELGLPEDKLLLVSAEHNRGLTDLKERLYDFACDFEKLEYDNKDIQKGVKPNHDVAGSVAIIGAPNAGKSTLLNRLIGAQRALVSPVAGATVDPIEGYFDLFFGHDVDHLKALENNFRKNNETLLEEYQEYEDKFAEQEMLAYDQMPEDLKNTEDDEEDESEFESTEIETEDYFAQEDIEASVDADLQETEEDESPEEEIQASEEVDPYRSIKLIDTAGIRKQKQVKGFIEEQSVYRSLKAITESDVVVFMVDATKGITHQDRRLCDITLEKGRSLIIVLNKVDLLRETMMDGKKKREWLLDLRATIPWLAFCELVTISAKKGSYMSHLKRSIADTLLIRNKRVSTAKLNKTVTELVDRHPIILNKSAGKRFRVKYASMIKASPPTFLFFTNKSQGIPETYRRYLQNGLRREFQLVNTPVHLIFRTATDIEKRLKKTIKK